MSLAESKIRLILDSVGSIDENKFGHDEARTLVLEASDILRKIQEIKEQKALWHFLDLELLLDSYFNKVMYCPCAKTLDTKEIYVVCRVSDVNNNQLDAFSQLELQQVRYLVISEKLVKLADLAKDKIPKKVNSVLFTSSSSKDVYDFCSKYRDNNLLEIWKFATKDSRGAIICREFLTDLCSDCLSVTAKQALQLDSNVVLISDLAQLTLKQLYELHLSKEAKLSQKLEMLSDFSFFNTKKISQSFLEYSFAELLEVLLASLVAKGVASVTLVFRNISALCSVHDFISLLSVLKLFPQIRFILFENSSIRFYEYQEQLPKCVSIEKIEEKIFNVPSNMLRTLNYEHFYKSTCSTLNLDQSIYSYLNLTKFLIEALKKLPTASHLRKNDFDFLRSYYYGKDLPEVFHSIKFRSYSLKDLLNLNLGELLSLQSTNSELLAFSDLLEAMELTNLSAFIKLQELGRRSRLKLLFCKEVFPAFKRRNHINFCEVFLSDWSDYDLSLIVKKSY